MAAYRRSSIVSILEMFDSISTIISSANDLNTFGRCDVVLHTPSHERVGFELALRFAWGRQVARGRSKSTHYQIPTYSMPVRRSFRGINLPHPAGSFRMSSATYNSNLLAKAHAHCK